MNRILWICLIGLLSLVACQKENIDETTTTIIPEDPTVVITTDGDLAGKIIDESGEPVADALVDLDNKQTYTNELGLFILRDVSLKSNGSYVTIEKDGYFKGSRRFIPTDNRRQNIIVQLVEKTVSGQFNSTNATSVIVEGNTYVYFQADGIVDENGNPYTGEVLVYTHKLDPSDPNMPYQMPGDLTAITADNDRVTLASYGMLTVELESPSGAPLQLAEGKTAKIHYEISPDLRANAPSTIPLWHFDEDNGIWVEEGEAVREENLYVGEVAHFSTWNCDLPLEYFTITGQVLNNFKNELDRLVVDIRLANGGGFGGFTLTDGKGFFTAPVPADESLIMNIKYVNNCDIEVILYSETIGPFNSDTQLPNIFVDFANLDVELTTFEASGTLTDCDGNNVFGLVQFKDETGRTLESIVTNTDGTFSTTVVSCNDIETVSLTAFSELASTDGSSTQNFAPTINFGTVALCDVFNTDEFSFVSVDLGIGIDDDEAHYSYTAIEYSECANMYYFEIAYADAMNTFSGNIYGIIAESSNPFTAGMTINGIGIIGDNNMNPTSIEITFISVSNDAVSGSFTIVESGATGVFSAPLSN